MFNRVCTYAVLKDKETGFTYAHFNAHFDHLGVIARQESVAVVTKKIAEIAPDMPVVFTGDLNENMESDMYKSVIASGFADAESFQAQRITTAPSTAIPTSQQKSFPSISFLPMHT